MPRRIVLSLAVAIAALLLGLVLAFLSRGAPRSRSRNPSRRRSPSPPRSRSKIPSPMNRRSRKIPRATFCVIMKAGWPSSGRRATPRR